MDLHTVFYYAASLDYCATVFTETGYVKNSFCKGSVFGISPHPGCQDTREYATMHQFFIYLPDYVQGHAIIGTRVKCTQTLCFYILLIY